MYVCMYVSLHFPFAPQYFPQKKARFFQRFRKEDVQKHRVFPDFRQKDAGSPSQQKSRQGESSLGHVCVHVYTYVCSRVHTVVFQLDTRLCSRRPRVCYQMNTRVCLCFPRAHKCVCSHVQYTCVFHVCTCVCVFTCAHLRLPRVHICVFTCTHMRVPIGHVFVFQENTWLLSDEHNTRVCSGCTYM